MKNRLIYLSAFALLMCGCDNDRGEKVEYTTSSPEYDYNVVKLFEAEGVSVYRFMDDGRYIYFTNANGKTSYTYKSGGKHRTTHKVESLNSKENEREDERH